MTATTRAAATSAARVSLIGAAAFGLGAVAAGTHAGAKYLAAGAGVITLAWFVKVAGRGVLYCVLLLVASNLAPGVAAATTQIAGGYFLSDLALYLLVALLLAEQGRRGFVEMRTGRVMVGVTVICAALVVLWVAEVVRSWAFEAVPLPHAVRFAEYIPYFAVLLPLMSAALRGASVRRAFVGTLTAWTCVVLIAAIYANIHPGAAHAIIHQSTQEQVLGGVAVERTYALGADSLALLALPFGLGAALLARSRGIVIIGAVLAALAITVDATSLTRALYVGAVAAAIGPVLCWALLQRRRTRLGRRMVQTLGLGAILVGLLVFVHPPGLASSGLSGATITSRISSIPDTLLSSDVQNSTVAYRAREASELEQYLGKDWLFGLGLLDPRDHFFVGLPEWDGGSILDSDVGVLNTVMVVGVLGAVLQLGAVVLILSAVLVVISRREPLREPIWIPFGVIGAALGLLATCATLVILFDIQTVPLCAAALGLSVSCLPVGGGRADGQMLAVAR